MSEPFLAEIRIFGFNFAPRGWATCDGQILPINQNQSLYSLLGTTYGGDGRTDFALPDLRGRHPVHEDAGAGFPLGQKSGEETHALQIGEIPSHDHVLQASSDNATSADPLGNVLHRGASSSYRGPSNVVPMRAGVITDEGAGQGHDNMQPFQVLNYCIALTGLFPSRN